MVVAEGINLHMKPLTKIEYTGSKRNPKQMCENPRRHVGSVKYIILRYYPPRRQVGLTGKR
jgi:hypothetical protein